MLLWLKPINQYCEDANHSLLDTVSDVIRFILFLGLLESKFVFRLLFGKELLKQTLCGPCTFGTLDG